MIEIDTNTLINLEIQLIFGALWYFLFCRIDSYFHENNHAKKAEQLHSNMRTVIFIFHRLPWRHKSIKGNRTIYYLSKSCRNEVYTTSRMLPEDNFSTFSDEEIITTSKAGLYSTGATAIIMMIIGLILKLYFGVIFIAFALLITIVLGHICAKLKKGWNDIQILYCPSEFRDYYAGLVNIGEDGYDKMIAYGEQCLAKNRKTK